MTLHKKLLISLLVLVAIYWMGVAGYLLIDPSISLDDAMYMVIITMSTVGYRETISDLGPVG